MQHISLIRFLIFSGIAMLLAACSTIGSGHGPATSSPPATSAGQKVGNPYQIAGVWYYPAINNDYDEIGTASWYGSKFHGRPTANGEIFNMNHVTAAHPTLPLPSTVRVTNLDNGRTLTVRVNDRGPFARGRILDLSRRSAQLLGFEKQGVAKVRVQLVRSDGTVADRNRTSKPRLLASNERPIGPLFVQVGAFGDRDNAQRLQKTLNSLGKVAIDDALTETGIIYRVRLGPFKTEQDAQRMLDRVRQQGFYDARIFTDHLG